MNSLAQALIPWAILALILVGAVALSALAHALYGWLKARGGKSKLEELGQLVLEHIVASIDDLKDTAKTKAAEIAADGKVTPDELRGLRDVLVKQVLETLPRRARAIGTALFGDMLGNFVATRVDAVLASKNATPDNPFPVPALAVVPGTVVATAAVNPSMPLGEM